MIKCHNVPVVKCDRNGRMRWIVKIIMHEKRQHRHMSVGRLQWPATVIPRVFLNFTCERETPHAHVDMVDVRT